MHAQIVLETPKVLPDLDKKDQKENDAYKTDCTINEMVED